MHDHLNEVVVCWFRRDLRLDDHAALYHALRSGYPVLPLFIFDTDILDKLPCRDDARVTFLHDTVTGLAAHLSTMGQQFLIRHGRPADVFRALTTEFRIHAVYFNHDIEPYAIKRDTEVGKWLIGQGIAVHHFRDHLIFEKKEIVKPDGSPYTIFTPYSKKWKAALTESRTEAFPSEDHLARICEGEPFRPPSLSEIGFTRSAIRVPEANLGSKLLSRYAETRDIPALQGTTLLGTHLRFGTLSIRRCVRIALAVNEKLLQELVWREFYAMILFNFPHVVSGAFRPAYNAIRWINDESQFSRWCEGTTGYPIVDAGMRELNQTGNMHNRVRMVVASFLVKHLLIDWRWGEAYFAERLLDFDLASNNGNWQWAAGCGCDAAPYFRVFNPWEQARKFDPKGDYIRKWVPEAQSASYPQPIVDHKMARERVLKVFKESLAP